MEEASSGVSLAPLDNDSGPRQVTWSLLASFPIYEMEVMTAPRS